LLRNADVLYAVWNKLASQKTLLSRSRRRMSLFAVVAWVAAAFLTTAYTTLVTPSNVVVHEVMNGQSWTLRHEVSGLGWFHMSCEYGVHNSLLTQYNMFDPVDHSPVQKISGCTWYRYNSSTGEAVFPTCPFLGDSSSLQLALRRRKQRMTLPQPRMR
jgi:hypothetical protein